MFSLQKRLYAHPLNFSAQSGNALFLILIAVALFAALSYAITQSGRGSGSISSEQAKLYAAQIASAETAIAQGVQRMILLGTPATALIAVNNNTGTKKWAGGGSANGQENTDFCTSGTNCIFAPDGGGITIPSLPRNAFEGTPSWLSSYFSGPSSFNGFLIDGMSPNYAGTQGMAVDNVGTSAREAYIQTYPLNVDVCRALNRGLGISGIPVLANGSTTYSAAPGQQAACILDQTAPAPVYLYYQVLVVN